MTESRFKFRAFDTERKVMITEPSFVVLHGDGEYFVYHENEEQWETEYHIILQWTGLKDKNGVDIYGRDIVIDAVGRTWAVRYHIKKATYVFCYSKNRTRQRPFSSFIDRQLPLEIIGNEFEHPHLLEQANDA